MGSHSVTCHLTEVRIPLLHPPEAGTQFSDPRGMQGWVDLCYVKVTGWELNPRPVNRKSNALPLSHLLNCMRNFIVCNRWNECHDWQANYRYVTWLQVTYICYKLLKLTINYRSIWFCPKGIFIHIKHWYLKLMRNLKIIRCNTHEEESKEGRKGGRKFSILISYIMC